MSLNLAEAAAVNTVIHHLSGQPREGHGDAPTREEATDALATLADGAFKRLAAGYGAARARAALEAWTE